MSNKEKLLEWIRNYDSPEELEKRRNRMGCCEGWYDFWFSMKMTFTIEEIESMTDREIELLKKLHREVAEGLF